MSAENSPVPNEQHEGDESNSGLREQDDEEREQSPNHDARRDDYDTRDDRDRSEERHQGDQGGASGDHETSEPQGKAEFVTHSLECESDTSGGVFALSFLSILPWCELVEVANIACRLRPPSRSASWNMVLKPTY